MSGLALLYKYLGPALWGLLPVSVLTSALVAYTIISFAKGRKVNEWIEVSLAHLKEVSVLLGFCGSIYALTGSFQVEGLNPVEIRDKMFFTLSTGFWSSLAGILVSMKAGIGLLLLKKF